MDCKMDYIEKYGGSFNNKNDIATNFQISPDIMQNVFIIQADYNTGDYCGDAHVLYVEDGKLFEVHGSHCSCYGLEDQWKPEETFPEAALKQEYFKGNALLKQMKADKSLISKLKPKNTAAKAKKQDISKNLTDAISNINDETKIIDATRKQLEANKEQVYNTIINVVKLITEAWSLKEHDVKGKIARLARENGYKLSTEESSAILYNISSMLPIYNHSPLLITDHLDEWMSFKDVSEMAVEKLGHCINIRAEFKSFDGFDLTIDDDLFNAYAENDTDELRLETMQMCIDEDLKKMYKAYEKEFKRKGVPNEQLQKKKTKLEDLKKQVQKLESEIDSFGM